MHRLLAAFLLLLPACFTYQPPPLELTAMPAWLIPYWIADMLVTLGLVLIGARLGRPRPHLAPHTARRWAAPCPHQARPAGLALIWLRTRLGGGRR